MEEISIQDILQMLKKNLILLLVVAICGGMLGYFWTNFAVDPIYSASATIYVKSEDAGSQTATEIVMAQYLTNSYCYIVNESHEVHEKVLQGLITKYPQLPLLHTWRAMKNGLQIMVLISIFARFGIYFAFGIKRVNPAPKQVFQIFMSNTRITPRKRSLLSKKKDKKNFSPTLLSLLKRLGSRKREQSGQGY